jgi:hypothetical protein
MLNNKNKNISKYVTGQARVDEDRIKSYLESKGFTVKRFSKKEMRAGSTPDFRVSRNSEFLFYCEVKSSSSDQWRDKQYDAAIDDLTGSAKSDPIFKKLTDDIHKAAKQFNAANKDQKYPNVIAFVNHDDKCGFNDLVGVLTGKLYTNDGKAHPIYGKFSHGRIKDEKGKIHLFIWLDDRGSGRLFFNPTNKTIYTKLCAILDIKQNEIKQIGVRL